MSNEENALPTKAYMYWVGRKDTNATNFNPHITSSEKEAEMLGDNIDELVRREDVEALIQEKIDELQQDEGLPAYTRKKFQKLLDEVQNNE